MLKKVLFALTCGGFVLTLGSCIQDVALLGSQAGNIQAGIDLVQSVVAGL